MARYEDLMELKNDTERMNVIRERVAKVCYEALKAEFGEDFSLFVDKEIGVTANASKVAKNTVVADVGDVLDKDKFTTGACIEICPKVKKWWDVKTKNGKTQYGTCFDDYKTAMEKKG
jgi:hypothetical protein